MKDDHNSDDVQQQTSDKGPAIPSIDEVTVCESQNPDCQAGQENEISRLEKGVERTNRLMEFLTALMVVTTAGGVLIAYFQWESAKTQFRQDQRPYVMSRFKGAELVPGKPIYVSFLNGNYGKSPAIRSGGAGKVFIGPGALQEADRWMKEVAPKVIRLRQQTIIAPNTIASSVEAPDTAVVSDRAIGADELSALLSRPNMIVAVMRQMYEDTRGQEYWTDTCVTNLPTPSGQIRVLECGIINRIE